MIVSSSAAMLPLHHDPHFTFRFADDRIVPRFHLEGVEAGRQVSVFKIDRETGERLGVLAVAIASDDSWVDLAEPIIVGGWRGVRRCTSNPRMKPKVSVPSTFP